MATRTGKVIMAQKIRMDREYKNVISYDEGEVVTLLTNNAIATFNNCSFLYPGKNIITLDMTYGNAIKCNYIGFQNPDYSNKWFFGFIDEIEYVADKTVNVHFTIDEFTTWYSYWSPEPCYVEREHANTDVAGDNLIPEQLELGEYVANGSKTALSFTQDSFASGGDDIYCWTSIYSPDSTQLSPTIRLGTNVCGIPISGALFATGRWDFMAQAMQSYSDNGFLDTVTSAFIVPKEMMNIYDTNYWDVVNFVVSGTTYQCFKFKGKISPYVKDVTLSAPTTVNGYTPVNKKLLTAPFICLMIGNKAGSSNVLCYEYFSNRNSCVIESVGTPVIGCSIFTFPQNYKGQTDNILEGISAGKFPTLSWSGDAYTNWLTQNAVNIGSGVIGDLAKAGIGAGLMATGNPLGLALAGGGIAGIASQGYEMYQHSIVPQVSMGAVNVGDVITTMRINNTFAQPMSIRSDMAQRIDQYFTRFGYRTNKNKVPNQFGRVNWNYVKIAPGEDVGIPSPTGDYSVISIPPNSMETINQVFRNGVTIWHDHANVGNFALTNPIMS